MVQSRAVANCAVPVRVSAVRVSAVRVSAVRVSAVRAISEGFRKVNRPIERGILPLVNALNGLDFIDTVYSCEGHFDRRPDPRFLPTAYVTFGVSDTARFRSLHESIRAIGSPPGAAACRLTYDCVLGRYTLSLWADVSMVDSARKRTAIDSAVARLVEAVSGHGASGSPHRRERETHGLMGGFPCGESCPPCLLVIPAAELVCPFIAPPEAQLGDSS
jgi:hypothetical protein